MRAIVKNGPITKLYWTRDDQLEAIKHEIRVYRIHEHENNPFEPARPHRYERARVKHLLDDLTPHDVMSIIAKGEFQRDPFYIKLASFLRQQEHHGWAGAFERDALNPHRSTERIAYRRLRTKRINDRLVEACKAGKPLIGTLKRMRQ